MDRFITPDRVWPEPSRWHVYVLPDLTTDLDLWRLVEQSSTVIAQYPVVSTVPHPWLHATVQMITGRAGAQVTGAQHTALIAALHDQVGAVAPFVATAGSVLANRTGVIMDLDLDLPGQPFAVLGERVRTAIHGVFGDDGVRYDPGVPHVTLAYAIGPEDSGVVQSQLRRAVRPSRAALTVDAVWLLDVIQDPQRSQYHWHEPLARIPLRGDNR